MEAHVPLMLHSMLRPKKDHSVKATWCSASREDLCAAVQCLRDNFFTYLGPFVVKSGVAAFKVSDYLLSADELVGLYKSGRLNPEGVSSFAKDRDAAAQRLGIDQRS
jgi:hypothetical protein